MNDNDLPVASEPCNLPFPIADMEPHPDFPTGPDLDLLFDLRETVNERFAAKGLRPIGRGVGLGGADLQFDLGGRDVIVTISIKERVAP